MNKVILLGRLTADPELRRTTTGKAVASAFLAVDRFGQEKATDFIPLVAWEKTAEFLSRYTGKGARIAVCGRLQSRSYEDKQGQKRTAYEVIVSEAHFADSKKESGPRGPVTADDFDDYDEDGDTPF